MTGASSGKDSPGHPASEKVVDWGKAFRSNDPARLAARTRRATRPSLAATKKSSFGTESGSPLL
jgi:hypothetical protein